MPTRRLLTSLGRTTQNQIQITAIRLVAVSRFFLRRVTLKDGITLEVAIALEVTLPLQPAGIGALGDLPLTNPPEVVVLSLRGSVVLRVTSIECVLNSSGRRFAILFCLPARPKRGAVPGNRLSGEFSKSFQPLPECSCYLANEPTCPAPESPNP